MADCPGVGKGIFKKIEAEKVRSVPKGEGGLPPLAPGAPKPLRTNFETKTFKFRLFLGPPDQNELYRNPLLSNI